jgi:hypothetical protein
MNSNLNPNLLKYFTVVLSTIQKTVDTTLYVIKLRKRANIFMYVWKELF